MKRRKAIRSSSIALGGLLSGPAILSLLQSCKSEPRGGAGTANLESEFLSGEESAFIRSFVETILPRTNTPGALDVGVDVFLDKLFARAYDSDGQANVRRDIKAFNDNCIKSHGKAFAELEDKDRAAVLKSAESNSGKFGRGVWGKGVGPQPEVSFYRSLKSTAIWAFMTSEKIGTEVLNYDPVPGDYLGCIPVSDVGNKWSL